MAIDFGLRRTGLAVTDPLQIIATGLTTVDSRQLMAYLKNYFFDGSCRKIIIIFRSTWMIRPPMPLPGGTL